MGNLLSKGSKGSLQPQGRLEEEGQSRLLQEHKQGQNPQPDLVEKQELQEEQYENVEDLKEELNTSTSDSPDSSEETKHREDTGLAEKKSWIDLGYVKPPREVESESLAILDPENYDGFKDLDVNMARLHFQHELPPDYRIVERIGHGAFGCCFLVEKQTELLPCTDNRHVVLKVVHGMFQPRRPVIFYKTCSLYTIMISFKAVPLILENLKFIVGMLKYLHTKHEEVHGDLNPGNMMYFIRDVSRDWWFQYRFFFLRGDKIKCLEEAKEWPQAIQIHALHDFLDHWFPMEDEQIACIIDADMGGKIGEAKIVVNHQHHDPRNATWQISDDLIGLINWIIIKTGYKMRSHATRGIEYEVSLESLKDLHSHIINLYRNLNNYFFFRFLFAPEEPFALKLTPGKCYLDELLKGKFLLFESFKGSYSLASSTDKVTSCVRLEFLEVMQAVPVKLEDLGHVFSMIASGKEKYRATLNTALNLLTSPNLHGGAVFVIVDKEHKNDLQLLSLDNDCLHQLCQKKANRANTPFFPHLLHAFCTPNTSDRWEQSLLEDLAANSGDSSLKTLPELAALKMQPKDGAFVLSHSGTVLAAAVQLKFLPQHYQLCKADGKRFGTRHAAALATAEWMRLKHVDGIVFVRSEEGEVQIMLPHGQTLSEQQEYPWVTEDDQKLPQVLCIEDKKKN